MRYIYIKKIVVVISSYLVKRYDLNYNIYSLYLVPMLNTILNSQFNIIILF